MEFRVASRVALERGWKYWTSLSSESGQGVDVDLSKNQVAVSQLNAHSDTPSLMLNAMYGLEESLN